MTHDVSGKLAESEVQTSPGQESRRIRTTSSVVV